MADIDTGCGPEGVSRRDDCVHSERDPIFFPRRET